MAKCSGIVLNITLTAGGASATSHGGRPDGGPAGGRARCRAARGLRHREQDDDFPPHGHGHGGGREAVKCHAERNRVKRSFMTQAIRSWIHAASSPLPPFARLRRRLPTAARPHGTRAAFAATCAAARAAAKIHVTHSATNSVLPQSFLVKWQCVFITCLIKSHTSRGASRANTLF